MSVAEMLIKKARVTMKESNEGGVGIESSSGT